MKEKPAPKKIVLAYSGGLDTSVILAWLKDTYGCEVIAFCADVGQKEELTGLEEKGKNTGASKVYIQDLRLEFARDFIYPAIRGNAIYEMRYLLGTSLARPLIAKAMADVAKKEGADAFSHGATGKGNDQVRFELTFKALSPNLQIIAPWRTWDFGGRADLIEYAKKKGIPVPVTAAKPYSMDRNLMHLSFEGGILEDPYNEPKEDMFILTVSPEKAPDKPTYLELDFENGDCVAIDGKKMNPLEVMETLNDLGGKNGVGRVDIVENRLVGIKSRGVYETPGGTILHIAHRDLESITLDRDTQHKKDELSQEFARYIYNGQWYSNQMNALRAYMDYTQKYVNGTVRIKLYKGNCTVVGRKSNKSLYNAGLSTFEKEELYNQYDAEGFINLYGLPMKEWARVNQ
ncbi:Argininosuccinate synthase [Leptospira biflexa serovar Patoc strain 'Patoc 1 (Ames)']|uniref:Argininosuccinate synthase n=2 Tax=Leptospira biflexa serovar Patoc TaxID=145259 RepID=ASSY_LEPBP|nr:argininosuccinate synthase [Leptospira biflexa]B0S9J6.1 RecName: Full=Argininosuccinate synthase; AltName: Full=Citrulline--aspartate ligase [Leptospira biflexa serovar Patoc strain 'Patoc 1 (Ames)']B0SJR2.1 RecName: Full=Argininosuccinate synthase; AltName: Full=Citrulline--aspartate ligase [Leptospira biflexa serovar Patoc strain 'Patoc 1 (Paris)']ABZ92633.1 Argininosuccinate synthase [Leptospira biflexa serovar Patoc strain 'Patoc 1 (Ames)']ABZ96234.1 Argininosuccinate synthase (Citrullin